ncbi:MAG: DUF1036 domain-containing protein [Parvularculales bacterium]
MGIFLRLGSLGVWVISFLGMLVAQGATAQGGYRLCNETSYVLKSAIVVVDGGLARSRGWFDIFPGDCREVLPDSLGGGLSENEVYREGKRYYVYARTFDVYHGGVGQFVGEHPFCVGEGSFDIENAVAIVGDGVNCSQRGLEVVSFRAADVDGDDWTTNFAEAEGYSLQRAKVAGIQRLLVERGNRKIRVDGYKGRYTMRTIKAFQRVQDMAVEDSISEALFEVLLIEAEKIRSDYGLKLCNTTQYQVWSAVGIEGEDNFITRGWMMIEPGDCLKVVRDSLGQDNYYIFAEAVDEQGLVIHGEDGPLAWWGERSLCVKPTRFIIRGQDNCLARGFEYQGFRAVESKGKPGITMTLSEGSKN